MDDRLERLMSLESDISDFPSVDFETERSPLEPGTILAWDCLRSRWVRVEDGDSPVLNTTVEGHAVRDCSRCRSNNKMQDLEYTGLAECNLARMPLCEKYQCRNCGNYTTVFVLDPSNRWQVQHG